MPNKIRETDKQSVCKIRSECNLPCSNCIYYEECKEEKTTHKTKYK